MFVNVFHHLILKKTHILTFKINRQKDGAAQNTGHTFSVFFFSLCIIRELSYIILHFKGSLLVYYRPMVARTFHCVSIYAGPLQPAVL